MLRVLDVHLEFRVRLEFNVYRVLLRIALLRVFIELVPSFFVLSIFEALWSLSFFLRLECFRDGNSKHHKNITPTTTTEHMYCTVLNYNT